MKLATLQAPSVAAYLLHHFLLLSLYFIPQVISYQQQQPIADSRLTINGIPYSTRAYWMRKANQALADLVSPCPFGAFGTVIVNHTAAAAAAAKGLGELVCIGVNSIASTGNPTLYGEIAAISNCTSILTNPSGSYNFNSTQTCPMCASAIRWAGFKEYIYGTSIETLIEKGWGQIRIGSMEVFAQSFDLASSSSSAGAGAGATRLMGGVLRNETDRYFEWQFDPEARCPEGCARGEGGSCGVVDE